MSSIVSVSDSAQRWTRKAGGQIPHVLHMTATPIPRTLALAAYGDLDFTLLRELPRGRRPIQTFVCATAPERERAYDRIREELRAGRQAFVVCPLVEESELLQARAATVEFERLRAEEFATSRSCCCTADAELGKGAGDGRLCPARPTCSSPPRSSRSGSTSPTPP